MYDIFFISYKESNAKVNLDQLKKISSSVYHIEGVKGIGNAHIQAATKATTDYFFIVDADNFVYDNFQFTNVPNLKEAPKAVHVWRCLNPVNQLVYGFGGVKLFPKPMFNEAPENYLDFTMTIAKSGYFIQDKLASETRFNVTPFESWKGGFREVVKLNLELHKNFSSVTQSRMETWLSNGKEKLNGEWAILGAKMGRDFSEIHLNQFEELKKINDYDWLQETFNQIMHV